MKRKTIHGIDPYAPGGIDALLAHHRLTFGDATMSVAPGEPAPAEPAAPVPAPAAPPAPPAAAKPWGDDSQFDPDKAWTLIENLRAELKAKAAPSAPAPAPVAAPAPNDSFGSQFDTPQPEPAPDSNQDNAQSDSPTIDPQIQAFEGRDYGVQPTAQLRSGRMHAPTPTSLPGAAVVSTQGLTEAIESGMDLVLIDVLGGDYSLPDALMAPALANSGHFRDRLQQQAGQWLQQVTGGETDMPIVLYCSDPMCWLSYNATLRTVAAGYTNVYWYRGGLQAWQMAGLRLVPAGF